MVVFFPPDHRNNGGTSFSCNAYYRLPFIRHTSGKGKKLEGKRPLDHAALVLVIWNVTIYLVPCKDLFYQWCSQRQNMFPLN